MTSLPVSLRRHGVLLAIVSVGLLVRLVMLFLYLTTHDWKAETWEAEAIAVNMLEGRGYSIYSYGPIAYRSLVAPGFPGLLYLLHLIGGRGFVLYFVVQFALAAGIIWLTFAIADRWFGRRTAIIASALVAVEPGLIIYHSYKVDDITPGMFLLLLGIQTFSLMSLSFDGRLAGCTGLIIGAAVLTRPNLFGMFGLLPAWAILERARVRLILKPALTIVLAAALVWVPWATRNYLIHGHFVFLTTFSGEAFWFGNNPHSFGSTVTLEGQPLFGAADPEFQRQIERSDELQKDALFKQEALRFIASDPIGFVGRSLRKAYYFWWFIPTYAKDKDYYTWIPSLLVETYKFVYAVIFSLAVLGVWRVVKEGQTNSRWMTILLAGVVISIMIIHSLTLVNGRHRVLIMPLLLIFTAQGLNALPELLTSRRRVGTHTAS